MLIPFSNTSTEEGLCQETDKICGTNVTTYPLKDKARRANIGLSRFISLALDSDGRWQFDDSNFTDLPIGTTSLVANQRDYSYSSDIVKVLKVQVLDDNGDYVELSPIDINDSSVPLETLYKTAGDPLYYDKVGSSILLYPAPDTTRALGLKLYFQREGSAFVSTDTTKVPGIPSLFHPLIALYMAEPFLLEKGLSDIAGQRKYNAILAKISRDESDAQAFFAKRSKDERQPMTGKHINAN